MRSGFLLIIYGVCITFFFCFFVFSFPCVLISMTSCCFPFRILLRLSNTFRKFLLHVSVNFPLNHSEFRTKSVVEIYIFIFYKFVVKCNALKAFYSALKKTFSLITSSGCTFFFPGLFFIFYMVEKVLGNMKMGIH